MAGNRLKWRAEIGLNELYHCRIHAWRVPPTPWAQLITLSLLRARTPSIVHMHIKNAAQLLIVHFFVLIYNNQSSRSLRSAKLELHELMAANIRIANRWDMLRHIKPSYVMQ
jgi:hypothetical protein